MQQSTVNCNQFRFSARGGRQCTPIAFVTHQNRAAYSAVSPLTQGHTCPVRTANSTVLDRHQAVISLDPDLREYGVGAEK